MLNKFIKINIIIHYFFHSFPAIHNSISSIDLGTSVMFSHPFSKTITSSSILTPPTILYSSIFSFTKYLAKFSSLKEFSRI